MIVCGYLWERGAAGAVLSAPLGMEWTGKSQCVQELLTYCAPGLAGVSGQRLGSNREV